MLYHFLYSLRDYLSALNIMRYLTFRSLLAFFVSLTLVLIFQPKFIKWFKEKHLSQPIRDDGPQSHLAKAGTPTMGGVVVVFAILVATFLFADLRNPYIWVTLGVTTSYGLLGFVDDYKKVKVKNSKGISARAKMFWQFFSAVFFLSILKYFSPEFPTQLYLPFIKNVSIDLGYLFIPFAAFVIVGCSNAVNLTDGLDGLVIGPVMTVASAYGVFAYTAGNAKLSAYLQIPYVSGSGDLAIFASAIVAGGLGFLWFNSFPAQVFMGDVGALALGGALGVLAVLTKQEIVLIIAGGVFVLEALSVIVQVASFKMFGKRIFRMAPLHHHYELKGIEEPKIIVRAWIISIVLALLSLATLKLR
jgi:phospho-N-acetylmuramoyl-pentapeptide-transferase